MKDTNGDYYDRLNAKLAARLEDIRSLDEIKAELDTLRARVAELEAHAIGLRAALITIADSPPIEHFDRDYDELAAWYEDVINIAALGLKPQTT